MNNRLFEAKLYILKALTNLHVGSGEASYSVIDKQVQRDILTNHPQINSSSLKGALREYMTFKAFKREEGVDSLRTTDIIFGSEPNASDNNQKARQGYVNFHDAKLLSLPIRTDQKPFVRATSKEILSEYIAYCKKFNWDTNIDKEMIESFEYGYDVGDHTGMMRAEDWEYKASSNLKNLKELIGADIILLRDEDFRILSKDLPFIARNYLENGKSENLWYEEIVPRESLFYFVIEKPVDDVLAYKALKDTNPLLGSNAKQQSKKDKQVRDKFDEFDLALHNAQFYIGANTTVGYGLCEVSLFMTKDDTQGASDEPKAD